MRTAPEPAQETVMPSAPTETDLAGSGLVAGPLRTAPVAMSNWLPWHGHVMTPSSTLADRAGLVRAHGARRP